MQNEYMDTQAAGVGRFTDDSCYEGKKCKSNGRPVPSSPGAVPPAGPPNHTQQAGRANKSENCETNFQAVEPAASRGSYRIVSKKVEIAKQTLCTFALARMPKLGATKTSLPGKTLPYENTVRAGLQGRWWTQPAAFTDSPTDVGAPLPYLRTLAFDLNPLKVRARRWLEATSLARIR